MKHTLKLIPLSLAIAALSACHQGGVGVDAGASQKAATGSENALRSERGIQQRTAARAAVQMPASAFIINTISTWGESQLATAPSAREHFWSVFLGLPLAGVSLQDQSKVFSAMSTSTRQAISDLAKQHPNKAKEAEQMMPSQIHPQHQAAAQFIAMSAQPLQGWPVGGLSRKGQEQMSRWARWSAQNVAFSNLIISEIAATPALRDALADPDAARGAIIAAFLSIPSSQLEAAWQQAARSASGELSLDMTGSGPAPVHFIISGNDFQDGPAGWKWAQSGTPWFGEGRVNGKQIMLGLDSAIDKTTSQSSTAGTAAGTGTEQGAGGSAGVK